MKHLKKYESFDFEQTIPVTTKNFLTNFYSCDDCDKVWKEFNNTAERCRFCNSDEIEELHEEEWKQVANSRMSPEEFAELSKEDENDELVDLVSLKKPGKRNVN